MHIYLALLLFISCTCVSAQSLLDGIADENSEKEGEEVSATFKANRILLGQSIKSIKKGELNFAVMHNFGALSSGFYEFFGLDGANTALNFDYGVSNSFNVGIGRSTYNKTFQGYVKQKMASQSNTFPLSISLYASAYIYGMKWPQNESNFTFGHRLSYASQLLLARKFSRSLSIQLSPTYIHKNLVLKDADNNNIFALALASRLKLSTRTALVGEFSYVFPNQISAPYENYFALGINFETGGHVFQLRLSNATSLYEPDYMTTLQSQWLKGNIHFGFTINRRFTLWN